MEDSLATLKSDIVFFISRLQHGSLLESSLKAQDPVFEGMVRDFMRFDETLEAIEVGVHRYLEGVEQLCTGLSSLSEACVLHLTKKSDACIVRDSCLYRESIHRVTRADAPHAAYAKLRRDLQFNIIDPLKKHRQHNQKLKQDIQVRNRRLAEWLLAYKKVQSLREKLANSSAADSPGAAGGGGGGGGPSHPSNNPGGRKTSREGQNAGKERRRYGDERDEEEEEEEEDEEGEVGEHRGRRRKSSGRRGESFSSSGGRDHQGHESYESTSSLLNRRGGGGDTRGASATSFSSASSSYPRKTSANFFSEKELFYAETAAETARSNFKELDDVLFEWLQMLDAYKCDIFDSTLQTLKYLQYEFFATSAHAIARVLPSRMEFRPMVEMTPQLLLPQVRVLIGIIPA